MILLLFCSPNMLQEDIQNLCIDGLVTKDPVSEEQETHQKYKRYMTGLVKFSYIGMVGKIN